MQSVISDTFLQVPAVAKNMFFPRKVLIRSTSLYSSPWTTHPNFSRVQIQEHFHDNKIKWFLNGDVGIWKAQYIMEKLGFRSLSTLGMLAMYHWFRRKNLQEKNYVSHPLIKRDLTLSQTTLFRIVQIERVCRRQFQIWWKWQKVIQMGRKHCGKRRNCSLRAISPFPIVFSKEIIMGKEEIAHNKQFLLFPKCLLLNQKIVCSFVSIFDIISVLAAELQEPKIGMWGDY